MRKAFDVETGPLTDTTTEPSERQALSDLFAGAIGTYKNPHSHRDVLLTDPAEAVEIGETTRGDRAFSEAPLKFSVEREHSTIAWLVRLGLIPPNETQNLAAILAALNRIGLTPSIS